MIEISNENGSTEIVLETKEEAVNICHLGKGEGCCAFLTMGSKGFTCVRMYPEFSASIIRRLAKGSMNAKGTGGWPGCPWEGQI